MNRRLRSLAALLALVGFTALLAESLIATSCMPSDGTPSAAVAMHDGMHDSGAASPDPEPDTPAPQDCPLLMTGGSCLVAATLPATTSLVRLPIPGAHTAPVSVADAADEFVARTLFRPPRV